MNPDHLIEIEVDAVVAEESRRNVRCVKSFRGSFGLEMLGTPETFLRYLQPRPIKQRQWLGCFVGKFRRF